MFLANHWLSYSIKVFLCKSSLLVYPWYPSFLDQFSSHVSEATNSTNDPTHSLNITSNADSVQTSFVELKLNFIRLWNLQSPPQIACFPWKRTRRSTRGSASRCRIRCGLQKVIRWAAVKIFQTFITAVQILRTIVIVRKVIVRNGTVTIIVKTIYIVLRSSISVIIIVTM